MITMTLAAFGPVMLIECVLVFAAVKQTGISRVAKIATSAHSCDSGRSSCVVAVASVAPGCAQITTLEQRAAMHAGAIFRELRRRKWRAIRTCEPGHDFGIGVAGAARFRHTLRIHFRLRILGRTNAVNAMATHARRRAVVVFIEQRSTMWAILEFRELIGRQRGVKLMHEGRSEWQRAQNCTTQARFLF